MVQAIPGRSSRPRKSCNIPRRIRSFFATISSRNRLAILLVVAATFALTRDLLADKPAHFPAPKITQYVPADTGLLVYSDRILATQLEVNDDGILQLMLKFSGGDPVSWKTMLAQSLGLESNAALRELLKERFAIAALDWDHLEDGVIIIDEYNPRLVQLVTGRGRVKNQEKNNNVNIFQTPGGMWVAATRRILILSQKADTQSIFRRSAKLLAGANDPPLSSNPDFQTCIAGLPETCRACLYWHDQTKSSNAAEPASKGMAPLWASGTSNTIGLQGRQNLLEITHVGEISTNGVKNYRPRVRFQQVRQLPQTTLASWSTTINWREFLTDPDLDPKIIELLKIVGVFGEGGQSEIHEDIVANLGPRCTMIVAADFADKDLRPRAAIMIESTDSQAIVAAVNRYVQNGAETNQPTDSSIGDDVESDDASKVHTIEMPQRSSDSAGDTIGALIAESLAPTYAAIDGWFILSTSPDHAKEIIEASRGESPRLEDVLPIHAHTRRVSRAIELVVVQPSFLHGILQFWESQLNTRVAEKPGRSRLDIEVRSEVLPGQVVVVDVDSNGVAANLLQPGDRILACNAILLDFANPNQHLKAMLAPDGPELTLRVLRGDNIVDVAIPKVAERPAKSTSRIKDLLSGAEPFQSLFLNSTIALYIKERPSDRVAVTRLAIELDRTGVKPIRPKSDNSGSR